MRCWRCGVRNPAAAAFCVNCQADLSPRSPLSRSLKHAAAPPPARPDAPAKPARPSTRLALGISLALALALGLAGVGAVRAADVLQYAMRSAGPADVAAAVCDALKAQQYDRVARLIDTSAPPSGAGSAPTPAAIQTQLRALDKISGPVRQCQLGRFDGSAGAGQYPLLVQRAKAPLPSTIVLQLRRGADSSWKISPATDFAGASA